MNKLFLEWIGSFGVAYSIDANGIYNWENWDNTPLPTQDDITEKKIELDEEWNRIKYQRDRKAEYPEWDFQLDYIFHNGLEKWKTDIVQPVKDKYPKP